MKDGLDLHEQNVAVLFKPGHYDILYSNENLEKWPEVKDYDSLNILPPKRPVLNKG